MPACGCWSGAGERVQPSQTRKTDEIRVGRVHDGIVFEGNRGDLRVGHQVARGAQVHEQSKHALDVIPGWRLAAGRVGSAIRIG